MQGPRRDAGITGAKKVLGGLENVIKANFWEKQFQQKQDQKYDS